mmetsp:Transcript_7080/g.16953  ORF Transcript_7080/g.16953 Transcript_7080/m.16953 type:complete len:237 (+) Transcript_7080:292-1002(+)
MEGHGGLPKEQGQQRQAVQLESRVVDGVAHKDPGKRRHHEDDTDGHGRQHRQRGHRQTQELGGVQRRYHEDVGTLPQMVRLVNMPIPPGPVQHPVDKVSRDVHQDVGDQKVGYLLQTWPAPVDVSPALYDVICKSRHCRDRGNALDAEHDSSASLQIGHRLFLNANLLPPLCVEVDGAANKDIHEEVRERRCKEHQPAAHPGCEGASRPRDPAKCGQQCQVRLANRSRHGHLSQLK